MTDLLSKIKLLKNEILVCILLTFPLIPINYIGFLGFAVSFFIILKSKFEYNKEKIKFLVFSVLYYLTLVISLTYSKNLDEGTKEVIKTLLLFLFPITIIGFLKLKKERINIFFYFFIAINIILCFYIFFLTIEILSFKKFPQLNETNILNQIKIFYKTPYNVPFNWSSRNFEVLLFFHKAYISLSLTLASLFSLYLILNNSKKKYLIKFVLFLSYFLMFYFIIYMQSIPNLVGLIFGSLILLIKFMLKSKGFFLIAILCLFVTGFFINQKHGIIEKTNAKIENDFRKELWVCGLDIIKSDFIFGVGIGDQEDKLLSCYKQQNTKVYDNAYIEEMNCHNQFISFFISGGVISFLLFTFFILYCLYYSIKSKDILFFAVIALLVLNLIFENTLERIYGIFLFGFFMSFFIKRNLILNSKTYA